MPDAGSRLRSILSVIQMNRFRLARPDPSFYNILYLLSTYDFQ